MLHQFNQLIKICLRTWAQHIAHLLNSLTTTLEILTAELVAQLFEGAGPTRHFNWLQCSHWQVRRFAQSWYHWPLKGGSMRLGKCGLNCKDIPHVWRHRHGNTWASACRRSGSRHGCYGWLLNASLKFCCTYWILNLVYKKRFCLQGLLCAHL